MSATRPDPFVILFVLLFAPGLLLGTCAVIESLLQGNWGLVYIVIVEHGCSDAIANSPIIIAEMSDEFQKKPTYD